MRGALISVVVAIGLAGSPFGGAAFADEAYVCEGGRVAYVRFGQLEAMKRKDPCIAAYYGGEGAPETDAADERASPSPEAGLPVVRTTALRSAAGTRTTPATALKVPAPKDAPRLAAQSVPAPSRNDKVAARPTVPRGPAPLPVAHPDTDFRNVRILNAGVGESAIFKHAR